MPDDISGWINKKPERKRILLAFAEPRTIKRVQTALSIRKLTLKSFINNACLKCLNPRARKGRFYVLSKKARECLKPNCYEYDSGKDWECIGWVCSSPRMRLAVLRSVDDRKLYSEEIRMVASQFNCRLSRTWTRNTLKELEGKNLVQSEIMEHIRFFWITPYGQKIKDELAVIAPLSPSISSVVS